MATNIIQRITRFYVHKILTFLKTRKLWQMFHRKKASFSKGRMFWDFYVSKYKSPFSFKNYLPLSNLFFLPALHSKHFYFSCGAMLIFPPLQTFFGLIFWKSFLMKPRSTFFEPAKLCSFFSSSCEIYSTLTPVKICWLSHIYRAEQFDRSVI